MSRRTRRAISKAALSNPVIRQDACGIDIGATEIYVSVAPDRDEEPVRCFATFTSDLEALADWLKACHVKSVAMESTGVYWIPLFQILESRGFEVLLVNAHHLKSVPGRKSDVCDCQWIQYCHAVGLLNGSFRPPQEVCALRSIVRHRDDLVKSAAEQIQKMQKALTQMNLQIHHVLSDISGKSGLAIIDAILKGERDAKTLARLRDGRVKACEEPESSS
jgi:transposase